ncbi:MAG: hypothetical protein IJ849_00030 [Selenomonadaceae bacterium]|nr:hypothetical protein [Selenomonadaceae bacterium]
MTEREKQRLWSEAEIIELVTREFGAATKGANEAKVTEGDTVKEKLGQALEAAQSELETLQKKLTASEAELTASYAELRDKKAELAAKDSELRTQQKLLAAKDTAIRDKQRELEAKEAEMAEKLAAKEAEMAEKLAAKEKKIFAKQDELDARNAEIKIWREKLNAKDDELAAKTEEVKRAVKAIEPYAPLAEGYKLYLELPVGQRDALREIFGGGSILAFISGAAQRGNLAPFWDYLAFTFHNETLSSSEADLLRKLFAFSFELAAQGDNPPYELILPTPGESFDAASMEPMSGESARGKVRRVILPGYAYRHDGKAVKLSLVELG